MKQAKVSRKAKASKRAVVPKVIEVKCENCGELIDLEECGLYRSFDKKAKKWEFFCNSECCAGWFGEEVDGEQIVEDLESDGYRVLNKKRTFRVLYEGDEIASGIEAEDEDEALDEVRDNLDVEEEKDDC